MTSLSERLIKIKEIGQLALDGKSDEEIAQKVKLPVGSVYGSRRAMGIVKRRTINILQDWKYAYDHSTGGGKQFSFNLSRVMVADLGLDPDKPLEFKGKIEGKTIVLKIRHR